MSWNPKDVRRRWPMRVAALVIVGMLGILASFATTGAASGTSNGSTTSMAGMGSCTRDHPCANPGCTQAGHGPLDCYTPTTTTTTEPTTTTTSMGDCTRDHPCPNPGCTEAGHGPLDCYTPPTTTTTTTTTVASPTPPPMSTNAAATATASTPVTTTQAVTTTTTGASSPVTPPASVPQAKAPSGAVLGARSTQSKPVTGRARPARAVVKAASFTG